MKVRVLKKVLKEVMSNVVVPASALIRRVNAQNRGEFGAKEEEVGEEALGHFEEITDGDSLGRADNDAQGPRENRNVE